MRARSACISYASGVVRRDTITWPAMWRSAVDDRPVVTPELAEDPLEQVRDARLAVGPGRCEQDRQVVVATGAVHPRGEVAEQSSRVVDDDDRQPAGGGAVGAGGIRHDGDGALLGGGGGELGAVAVRAADGDEHVAGAQIGGREGEPGERRRPRCRRGRRRRSARRGRRGSGRGARPGGARGAGSRARRSAWRIHLLTRAGPPACADEGRPAIGLPSASRSAPAGAARGRGPRPARRHRRRARRRRASAPPDRPTSRTAAVTRLVRRRSSPRLRRRRARARRPRRRRRPRRPAPATRAPPGPRPLRRPRSTRWSPSTHTWVTGNATEVFAVSSSKRRRG